MTSEEIYLNSQPIQKTFQSWEPSKRTLQIEDHQRSYSYLGGRLSQISANGIILDYQYDQNGSLSEHSTSHASVTHGYHSSGLPKTITTHIGNEGFEERMQWDKSAKATFYTSNWKGTEERAFAYNANAQLKSINDEKYTFDFDKPGCGVRTESPQWTIPTSGLDPFGKIISEISNETYIITAYNDAGEVISRVSDKEKQNFKWDVWGNLIEITTNAYTWKASYDILGRRLQTLYQPKKGQQRTTISLYDPENEFDEIGVKYDGKVFWKFIGNQNCDVIADDNGNSVSLIHDALGKLIAVTDLENVHWNEELVTPYGPRGPPIPLEPTLVSFASAHIWQDRRMDPTGFIWMGARHYDPVGGKFLSSDPIGIPYSLDLYSYANGDPINFNDPDGRFFSPVYQTTKTTFIEFGQGLDWGKSSDSNTYDMFKAGQNYSSSFSFGATLGATTAPFNTAFESTMNFLSSDHPGMTVGAMPFGPGGTFKILKSLLQQSKNPAILLIQRMQTSAFSSLKVPETAKISFEGVQGGLKITGGKEVDFIVGHNGITISKNRKVLESGFQNAGFPTFETRSAGKGYILPNGNKVRIMEPSGGAPLRASFTNCNEGPINIFTGKPFHPSREIDSRLRREMIRQNSHLELTP